ncbi:type II restriction enzyme [Acidovorax sp. 93]|uniref:type II restriction endonuclease n=1 Tax=Acidovorax sp. 93 TaxID=2135632 RepID=UPI000EB603AE|nr:type II restriction endonuclease [Acidovorax sp. 93]RKR29541.1 type II restriction enzyme [Acidovorax sp. 93]
MHDPLATLIDCWKADPSSTYNTWFLWDQRIKNFRSIRRGIAQVVEDIRAGTFGNAYRGSSLETIVGSVAEQRQIFKGADHAFLWKPKLRIPDIYENPSNQRAFADLLHTCDHCDCAEDVVAAIQRMDAIGIKGLGPAVANLLYFIRPTLVSPFNTAIVAGFNAVTGGRMKLGRWDHYLSMREGLLRLNAQYRLKLSNDLGAIAGLMFDIGSGRYAAPPPAMDAAAAALWQEDLERVRQESTALQRELSQATESDATHTGVQASLRDLGKALGFEVWIASNDRGRAHGGGLLGDGCMAQLPASLDRGLESVRLIDVVWVDPQTSQFAAAFEVEHTTSIYSGIVRMLDLALGTPVAGNCALFLVAPDNRRDKVAEQLQRPAFSRVSELGIRYLPYSQLEQNHASMSRFGSSIKPLLEISQRL